MSWYSKRAVLVAVYSACEIHMLQDFSPRFSDTWAFLDRRMDDAMAGGKAAADSAAAASALLSGLPGALRRAAGLGDGGRGAAGGTKT